MVPVSGAHVVAHDSSVCILRVATHHGVLLRRAQQAERKHEHWRCTRTLPGGCHCCYGGSAVPRRNADPDGCPGSSRCATQPVVGTFLLLKPLINTRKSQGVIRPTRRPPGTEQQHGEAAARCALHHTSNGHQQLRQHTDIMRATHVLCWVVTSVEPCSRQEGARMPAGLP